MKEQVGAFRLEVNMDPRTNCGYELALYQLQTTNQFDTGGEGGLIWRSVASYSLEWLFEKIYSQEVVL